MMGVRNKTCGYSGCTKQPSHGVGATTAERCAKHAEGGDGQRPP